MKNAETKSFIARVRASLPELHPSERRLAEAVLNFPGDMAGYSASEIAELAAVSNATVSRFVRKIGYGSYEEARKAVRDEGRTGAALLRMAASGRPSSNAIAAHLEQSRTNLQRTLEGVDPSALEDLIRAMAAAPRVWIAGFRAGFPLASYLGWQVSQVLPQVQLIPRPGETLAETAASFGPDDVLLLIALRRGPKQAATLAEAAHECGTRIAYIGDIPTIEALPVSWRFPCTTASNGSLLNHTAVLAICNLIASQVVERTGAAGRDRLGAIEAMHDRFGEL